MHKWQPIETAPKDGTRILIGWFVGADGQDISDYKYITASKWEPTEWEPGGTWRSVDTSVEGGSVDFIPTHWMHCPEFTKED